MSEVNGAPGPPPPVDYLAPFEAFQSYRLHGGTIYRGRIRAEYAADREALAETLSSAPGTFRIEEVDGRVFATLRTYRRGRPPRRLWLHGLLLVLASVTCVGAGAGFAAKHWRDDTAVAPFAFVIDALTLYADGHGAEVAHTLWPEFAREMATGVSYALALLFLLLAHEAGHYFAARAHGIDCTLPFIIPAPFLFGTLGAIIKMRAPISHRRALFDIGVAGPLAGIVASLVVCLVGLSMSSYVVVSSAAGPQIEFGASLLYRGLGRLAMGPPPLVHSPATWAVQLHPVAVAGWFGLFVTFLNLMPLGQLDGGHLWYALIGRKQRIVGIIAFALLLALSVVFIGWLMFAVLIFLVLRISHPPVMDEYVRLGAARVLVGVLLIVLFVLMFIPEPVRFNWH